MQHSEISRTLQVLMARFNGRVLIPFGEGATALGFVEGSARNQLSRGTFPVRTILQGSRRYIAIDDLAGYIDGLRGHDSKKTQRGRPTKSEQIVAKTAGLSVQAWREQQEVQQA